MGLNDSHSKNFEDERNLPISIEEIGPRDIPPEDMNLFVENLINTNFVLDESLTFAEGRNRIRGVMMGCRDRFSNVPVLRRIVKSQRFDEVVERVYPDYSRQEHIEGSGRSIQKLINEGQVFGVRVDDRIVAIMGVKKSDHTFEGKPVFEFTKASTLGEFKGRGFNKLLLEHVIEKISKSEPTAIWFSCSRNAEYLTKLKARGWSVYDFEDPAEQAQFMRESIGDYWKTLKAEGYKVLFRDPNSKSEPD